MNWAQKYRSFKDKSQIGDDKKILPPETLFHQYQDKLRELSQQFASHVEGTVIQAKYHKLMISLDPRESTVVAEREKVDALVLSDNDNELKLIPEGIHFIGVLGRVSVRAYKKVYSFNSVIEKRIKILKESYFFLYRNQDNDSGLSWGYIREEDNFFGREVTQLTDDIIEQILDEVFIYT